MRKMLAWLAVVVVGCASQPPATAYIAHNKSVSTLLADAKSRQEKAQRLLAEAQELMDEANKLRQEATELLDEVQEITEELEERRNER